MNAIETVPRATPRPRVGVAVLVVDRAGKLLLGRRGKEPNYGKWVIPGGAIEHGETWVQAATREIFEETRLVVNVPHNQRPFILEILTESEHRLVLCVTGTVSGGNLRAASDLLEARFFARNEIPHAAVSPAVLPVLTEFGWWARERAS